MTGDVDPVSRSDMLAQLENAASHGLAVAEQSGFETADPDADPGLHFRIPDGEEPLGEGLATIPLPAAKDFERQGSSF